MRTFPAIQEKEVFSDSSICWPALGLVSRESKLQSARHLEFKTMGENEMIHPHLSPNFRNREVELKIVEMNELRKNRNGNNSALRLQYDLITGVYPTNESI